MNLYSLPSFVVKAGLALTMLPFLATSWWEWVEKVGKKKLGMLVAASPCEPHGRLRRPLAQPKLQVVLCHRGELQTLSLRQCNWLFGWLADHALQCR